MKFRSRLAVLSLVWLGATATATWGQAPPAPGVPRSEEIASISRAAAAGRLNAETLAITVGPKAIAKADGMALPGLKVVLDGTASSGGRVWYRWIQTQGPQVSLQGSDQARAQFVVPDEGVSVGFVLVVGNSAGVDARLVLVEVEDPDRTGEEVPLKAVAGEDRTAVVGKRVVLDAIKSEPKGRVRCRWVQLSGPKPESLTTTGTICSFVPPSAGSYQFALLVIGSNDLVSEPALVTIQARTAKDEAESGNATRPALAIDELARTAILSIAGGARYANDLGRAFDAVAERIDSCKTYLDIATELNRRIDGVVPRDPGHRAEWVERFFKPWMARVADLMRLSSIDLSKAEGQTKALTKAQRIQLADQLRLTAAGLRAGLTLR